MCYNVQHQHFSSSLHIKTRDGENPSTKGNLRGRSNLQQRCCSLFMASWFQVLWNIYSYGYIYTLKRKLKQVNSVSLTFNTWQQHWINVSRSITCSTTSEATTASNVSAVSSTISSKEHTLYSTLLSRTGSNDLWCCAVLMFSSTGSIPITEAPSRPRG